MSEDSQLRNILRKLHLVTSFNLQTKSKLSSVLMKNILKDDVIQQLFVAMRLDMIGIVQGIG